MDINFDLRIAEFIKKVINFYIKKRVTYRSRIKDAEWLELFHNKDNFIFNLDDKLKILLFKDDLLSRLIYNSFEKAEIDFLKYFLKEEDVFLDIGANIGLFSLYASNIVGESGKIFAFEPTPKTFVRLNSNIELNKKQNIVALNIGLSNEDGLVDFNVSNDGYDAWNSIVDLDILVNRNKIKIKFKTLDSFIEEYDLRKISLVKLDVEGWEKFVLQGSHRLLSKTDAPVFLVEFAEKNAFKAGYYCNEVFDLMESYGYSWFSYSSINNKLIKEKRRLHYPYINLIAIKNFSGRKELLKGF